MVRLSVGGKSDVVGSRPGMVMLERISGHRVEDASEADGGRAAKWCLLAGLGISWLL